MLSINSLRQWAPKQLVRSLSLKTARIASNGESLDANLMAENFPLVKSHLIARKSNSDLVAQVEKIASLRAQRNSLIVEGDKARSARKKCSQIIGQLMKEGKQDEVGVIKAEVDEYAKASAAADDKLALIDKEIDDIILYVPNLLDDMVPEGNDDKDNPVVSSFMADSRKVGNTYKWHDDIAQKLGGLNIEAAAKISGARFSVLVGPIAKLERALIQYFLDFHTSRGYTEVSVPYIVSRSTLQGTGNHFTCNHFSAL